MNKNWTYRKLGLCYPYIKNGANIKQIADAEGYPITRIETLSGGVFNRDRMGYANVYDLERYNDYILEDGDLLMSHINSKVYIGRTVEYKAEKEEQIIHGMNLLRLKGNDGSLKSSFFAYYTQSESFKSNVARIRKDAVNQSSFAISDLKNINIPVPDIRVQNEIIDEFESIKVLIEIKEKQLQELEELEQTIFHDMFGDPIDNEKGWTTTPLNKICDVRDGTHDSPKYLASSNYVLITSKNVVNGFVDFTNVNYISETDYNEINKRSKVDEGDIIMPMVGTIGKPCLIHNIGDVNFAIKNVALIKFHKDSSILNTYLLDLIRTHSFSNYLKSKNKGGTQKFVSLGTIRQLPIIVPSIDIQRKYCVIADNIQKQIASVKKTKSELEEIRASRMQYWFD